MKDWRPKFRGDVQAHDVSPGLVVLDTWTGIERLADRLAPALRPLLKGEALDVIIDHAGEAHTLDVLYELDELRGRALLNAREKAEQGDEPPVVLTEDYLDPRLEEVNRGALETGRPWILARPRGTIVWVGPVFVPGRGPCWTCLSSRLRAVRAAWRLPERRAAGDEPLTPIGLELAALEAAGWKEQVDGRARLLTFDTQSLALEAHVIVRRNGCPACGDPSMRHSFKPLILQSRGKTFTFDGGHRAVPPEETYARHEHLVSPLAGVVHDVRRAHGDTGSLNVFAARHNYRIGKETIPRRSFGKGVTAAQARTGALCEAVERYCGLFHGDEPLVRASLHDLEDGLHPNTCLLISERQYHEREQWNGEVPPLLWLGQRFDEEHETDWVKAWSLTHERERHVPAALCYYGHRDSFNDFAHADSNGNAAGTCVEDAILQGLLEVIERDAAGIWWYSRTPRPAVAVQTPYVRAMTREYAARGRRLWLLDLTTDVGIPVCAAVSMGERPEGLHVGFGAHLDPAIAVTRAISEANQMLAFKRGRRVYGELSDWTFLEPEQAREMATVVQPSDDLRQDVLACVDILRRLGLEVIVLDQTRADVGLPVVKVIVPGLRHFRPRFAPGRLYDVPLRLGWAQRSLREDELNPSHLTS
jgi:bacteriocin biosynthesis cyclodehydratase domain-containing protein